MRFINKKIVRRNVYFVDIQNWIKDFLFKLQEKNLFAKMCFYICLVYVILKSLNDVIYCKMYTPTLYIQRIFLLK